MEKHLHPWHRRRVVSKSLYVAQVGGKAIAALSGMAIILIGLIGFICGLSLMSVFMSKTLEYGSEATVLLFIGVIGAVLGGSYYALRTGLEGTRSALRTRLDIPMTRNVMEQLPPEESLVRGAAEPQARASQVLLRAALKAEETPSEQLLRSTKSD